VQNLPEPIGWIISIENSRLVMVGLKSGIALLDPFREKVPLTWIDKSFPGDNDLRLNDAKIDKFGNLWCGAMSLSSPPKSLGLLAQYSFRLGTWTMIDSDYVIPNGPAFNCDDSLVLHNDSAKKITYRYRVNKESGVVEGRSIWREFKSDAGLPDGMTFDAEGHVWIAHWGVGEVRRYDPNGKLRLVVPFPVSQVTNVCFGGPQLDRLFVTSAKIGLTEDSNSIESLAGSLFEIEDHGVKGLPSRNAQLGLRIS
jgi:sugar lactone lactonase YvrE